MSLAIWRITYLLVREDGPFNTFSSFRDLLGVFYDTNGKPQGTNVIAQAFTCIYCLSIWISIILVICYIQWPNQVILLCLPFALSSGAIVINRIING